jgi:hypothetical protein
MTPHVHISLVSFLITGAYLIIWGFMWRSLSARWSDNAVGQAMAYIF